MDTKTLMNMLRAHVLVLVALMCGTAIDAQDQLRVEHIAGAVVIGQAYVSGNVYVGGFDENESRRWPGRIAGVPLQAQRTERVFADFFRTVVQSSEEQSWFPQREADMFEDDVFATIDRAAVEDRNLARYRAEIPVEKPLAFLGWDERLQLTSVDWRDHGQPRPLTSHERAELDAGRKSAPRDVECTTVPQFLDDAKIILTAAVSDTDVSIRLSKYSTPGCAGHLSDVYVLDVIEPGRDPRRFEFRHYAGLL